MEKQTNQKNVEHEILQLLKTYNALYKAQLYALFGADGKEKYVGRALKVLEKEHLIYVNQVTKIVSPNEASYAVREKGTMMAVWALIKIMGQREVEQHFLASKEEYPVQVIFTGDGKIYDIMYVPDEDIELTNNLFARKRIVGCGHIVVVENPESIPAIQISDVLGFCTVDDEGEVEYYRKNDGRYHPIG